MTTMASAAVLIILMVSAIGEAGAQTPASTTPAGSKSKGGGGSSGASTAPLPSRCLARATPEAASYRVELAPVLEFDALMTAPPDAACWDVYSRNDTCKQSSGAVACGMGDPTALRVSVANKCVRSSSVGTGLDNGANAAARTLNVTINGIDGDLIGSTATLLPSASSTSRSSVLHITLPPLGKRPGRSRRVCVQFNSRCPTLSDMCASGGGGKASSQCQIEMRGRPRAAAARRTGCALAGATFSVSSDALVQYDVDISQNFTRAAKSNCPPRAEMKAYLDELGSRAGAELAAPGGVAGDRIAEMIPTGCMPMGTGRALLSGIMVAIGPVGAGARATAALKRVSAPVLGSSPALATKAFAGSGVGWKPEQPTDTGEGAKIPDFLNFLGAGFDASQYYPYPSMASTSQALNPKQWLRSEPILDRKSLGRVGYSESNVEVCNVKAELRTAKSASEAKDLLEVEAKLEWTAWITASASAAYKSAVETTASSETMMGSSSIDCMVASYELASIGRYRPTAKFANSIQAIVDREIARKDAQSAGETARAKRLADRNEAAMRVFKNDYGTSFVTRFNLGAFMYLTMQFEASKMATRVEKSKSLEVELSTTFASVSGKVSNEQTRANSLENEAVNSRITASPLGALPTFKPANGGDNYQEVVVDVQAWQQDIYNARKDPVGRERPDVDDTNNAFYPFPDTKTHQFMWDWLEESLVYVNDEGAGFWEDAFGDDAERVIDAFAELYKNFIFRDSDVEQLKKVRGGCFPSPLVVRDPNNPGKCATCLDSSDLFGAGKGYCNPQGTAACFWNNKGDTRPGCICAPPCYGINPITKLRDCYREGGRMHHPWARDDDKCPVRPFFRDIAVQATKHIPEPKDCLTRFTEDGSPISDLLRDRVYCRIRSDSQCAGQLCDVAISRPETDPYFCWKPPGQDRIGGLQYRNGAELAPTVYTVLAVGCDRKGKCKFPIEDFRRQYAGGAEHACKYYSVRKQVDDCTAELDPATGELRDTLRDPVAKPYFVDLPGPPPGSGTMVWSHVPPSKCLAQIVVPPGGLDADLTNWVCQAGRYPHVATPIPPFWEGVSNLGDDFGKLCPRV